MIRPFYSIFFFLIGINLVIADPGLARTNYLRQRRNQGKPSYRNLELDEDDSDQRFHVCNDIGEAFSASFLVTTEMFLSAETAGVDLNQVNCARGAFSMMRGTPGPGLTVQSLNVLDFSVVHLSGYERLLRRHRLSDEQMKTLPDANVNQVMKETVGAILKDPDFSVHRIPQLERTVAIIPFYGISKGTTESKTEDRQVYLEATFWSVYSQISNVIIFVMTKEDELFCRNLSELPFYDVVLIENLPDTNTASLPFASIIEMQKRLVAKIYDFDFVYYTEADQVLLLRYPENLFKYLEDHPMRTLTPHRLIPFPRNLTRKRQLMVTSNPAVIKSTSKNYGWKDVMCCIPKQNCLSRDDWVEVFDQSVQFVDIYGLYVALGNSDFHKSTYRTCSIVDAYSSPEFSCVRI